MLVVVAIITLISATVLANNNRFGGVIQLENLAYNVALSVRQAQVYGISVRRVAGTFGAGYGMYFDSSTPTAYVLYADTISQNGLYTCAQPGTSNCEAITTTSISGGYQISDLCYTPQNSSTEICNSTTPGAAGKLHILFKRPEPDAYIGINAVETLDGNGAPTSAIQQNARVVLRSPRGDTVGVRVDNNGQITVQHIVAQ